VVVKLGFTLREEHRLRVCENGAEENIWTQEGGSGRRLEKPA
jgi:hypothetical protein